MEDEIASLVANVPMSVLPDPSGAWNKIKYIFWRGITPYFLFLRDGMIKLNLIHHTGRQHYLLGKLSSTKKLASFLIYIESRGFSNHFIAWKDEDQLVSLRRFDGFERQYHLRIFKDGEIRGHYEYTPESHPVSHLFEVGIQERRAEFSEFLGNWIK